MSDSNKNRVTTVEYMPVVPAWKQWGMRALALCGAFYLIALVGPPVLGAIGWVAHQQSSVALTGDLNGVDLQLPVQLQSPIVAECDPEQDPSGCDWEGEGTEKQKSLPIKKRDDNDSASALTATKMCGFKPCES